MTATGTSEYPASAAGAVEWDVGRGGGHARDHRHLAALDKRTGEPAGERGAWPAPVVGAGEAGLGGEDLAHRVRVADADPLADRAPPPADQPRSCA